MVSRYVYTYLDYLSALGFKVIFISNSPVRDADREKLAKFECVSLVVERENKGNDFGAWKYAFDKRLIPVDTDYLVLANDSVFGPVSDMTSIINDMRAKPEIDFWGLTDSYQGSWHIQSYFLCMSRKAFTSAAVKKVFSGDFSSFSKKEIIEKGEIMLTTELCREGFKGAAYIPYAKLESDIEPIHARNPTHYYYKTLIFDFGFPFIKKELLLQNPENLEGLNELLSHIRQNFSYPIENITDALIDTFQPPGIAVKEGPALSVVCHMYYASSIYFFLSNLIPLKSYRTLFVFNLSTSLFYDSVFLDILRRSFPEAIILYTPDRGRDIGGKLAGIDVLMKLRPVSDYTLIIHDKLSPHAPTGKEWRDKLFKILEENVLPAIFKTFEQNKKTGVVASSDFVKNEYDPDTGSFNCTSRENLLGYIKQYNLQLSNYNFVAGTIFWIRTGILRTFFEQNLPLRIRESLETGNVLDFNRGTNVHAWERIFSLLADAQGYKITGI